MVDAIVSVAIERLETILEEKIRDEINLVRGVKEELLYLSSELTTIRHVLDDAERRGYKEKSIQHWLKELEEISYDVGDVLDEWNFATLKLQIEQSENFVGPRSKVCSFIPRSCLPSRKYAGRRDIAVKIKGLKEKLSRIVTEKQSYGFTLGQHSDRHESGLITTTSALDISKIYGREDDKNALLVHMLEGVDREESGPNVISIVGAWGVGKTTLAGLVYKDDRVINYFKFRIWVHLSNDFDLFVIGNEIVKVVKGSSPNLYELNELEELIDTVMKCISGEKFLLVLDNVWNENYSKWDTLHSTLKCCAPGSKVLVTTRSDRVALRMGTSMTYHLKGLSETDCWSLISCLALADRFGANNRAFEQIGQRIAKKCKGLPLAAKVLGSLLFYKDNEEEWENILKSEMWQLEEVEADLFPKLFLSYNELSPIMKQCFSYCAIFPKDSMIREEKLIRMWMAQGYLGTNRMGRKGNEYLRLLTQRSFFEISDGVSCKMHDIIHDFARYVRMITTHNLEQLDSRTESRDVSYVSQIKVYRSLFCQKEFPSHALDSITCLKVLTLCDCGLQCKRFQNM